MAARFEIFNGTKGYWYFRLTAENGEPVLSGEGYNSRQACEAAMDSVLAHCSSDHRFVRKTAGNGRHYFVLTNARGEILGKSEMFTTAYGRELGISRVKQEAPEALVTDLITSKAI